MDAYFDSLLLSSAEAAEVTCGEGYGALEVPRFYTAFQKLVRAA